jgi:FdhD protein
MSDGISHTITRYRSGKPESVDTFLIMEEPLSIRIDGRPYAVVMRTPGDERAHVAGFCLAEGLIDGVEDIETLGFCTEQGVNVGTLTLMDKRRRQVMDLLDRKGFVSQTSCGICGKEVVRDLMQVLKPMPDTLRISVSQALACADMLSRKQDLHKRTRSAHAAMILDAAFSPMAFAEDVGRHNALDKAVGKVFLENRLPDAAVGMMSSRLSYELVQKAARAGLEILIGISRPTSLGVDLAESVNMTLLCVKNDDLLVFCGKDRLIAETHTQSLGNPMV